MNTKQTTLIEAVQQASNQQSSQHKLLTSIIWSIAESLRGTYRPPQYRRVMLPLIVLARFDAVLKPYTQLMKAYYEEEMAKRIKQQLNQEDKDDTEEAQQKKIEDEKVWQEIFAKKMAAKMDMKERSQGFYNTSGYNLTTLLADPEHISGNLISYLEGFSPKAKDIFDKFNFEVEIDKMDEKNILYAVLSDFVTKIQDSGVNLTPDGISDQQMGYVFEEMVRRFNEQANEEAGDHFTPREVIELMVNIAFHADQDELSVSGVYRSLYDPTAGTGGMLSVSEKLLKLYNSKMNITLYGQEYNAESYAICCADLLIKDEPIENIVYGDTIGIDNPSLKNKSSGFVPHDGHKGESFHYMFANPPYGVDWKTERGFVEKEYKQGFDGRFGAGLPRINDGSFLFLQHMISKMKDAPEDGGDGSRIAVVFNGSPLFTGDAGSGESNIRRWIIENDWLEAIIALPEQMFYNTGIYTYIWIVSNKKSDKRKGKVQLIDGTEHYQKMRKSLGNKRNELNKEHIIELTKFYANFIDGETSTFVPDKTGALKVGSKIFNNQDFGYIKVTVERPLRLNFQASAERIALLDDQSAFTNLAKSKKRKDNAIIQEEEAKGKSHQNALKDALATLDADKLYKDRKAFLKDLNKALGSLDFKVDAQVKKAVIKALSERDATAKICTDSKGNYEADTELRDTELVPLPNDIALPLPLGYDNESGLDKLVDMVSSHIEKYIADEVLPHVPDAWVDYDRTKLGYEIPINRHFYVYEPPRDLAEIKSEISELEQEVLSMLKELDV